MLLLLLLLFFLEIEIYIVSIARGSSRFEKYIIYILLIVRNIILSYET